MSVPRYDGRVVSAEVYTENEVPRSAFFGSASVGTVSSAASPDAVSSTGKVPAWSSRKVPVAPGGLDPVVNNGARAGPRPTASVTSCEPRLDAGKRQSVPLPWDARDDGFEMPESVTLSGQSRMAVGPSR